MSEIMPNEKEAYADVIRQMIKNEDEVRSQRTNWFLVIQGFLIAGLCQMDCHDNILAYLIVLIGLTTSLSFWHASWRSTLAVTFALSCWKDCLKEEPESKYPPVSLITKEILKKDNLSNHNSDPWIQEIYNRMNENKSCWIMGLDNLRNKCDCLLPYKFLPKLFLLIWIIYGCYLLYKQRKIIFELLKPITQYIADIC